MCVIVCVKQVKNLSFHSEDRSDPFYSKSTELFNNPYDLSAVSWAIKLKELYGFPIVTISMGPSSAIPQAKQLFSYGVDRVLLLASPILSGSDTYATSYSLGRMIKTFFPDYSLIICGDKSLDGETGQVPHSLATELNISSLANVSDISFHNGRFQIVLKTDSTQAKLMHEKKLLITVTQNPEGYSCFPKIRNVIDSKTKNVEVITHHDISLLREKVGYKGSFTKVISIRNREISSTRRVSKIYFDTEKEKLNLIITDIINNKL